ncbi:MAG: hypothetical protein HWN65_05775 [Candidatus Helarchaeota archaeon]|nr:hypothetical protein [Candidatus Helarchaeota archaeon]
MQDDLWERKLKVLQHILDEIDIQSIYNICIASQEGQILISSNKTEQSSNIAPVAEKISKLFKNLKDLPQNPNDIVINCPNEKIYFQRIPKSPRSESFLLLIVSMSPNCLYFRRALKKNVNRIKIFLN